MLVNLFVKYEDIEKYNEGKQIEATDLEGKGIVFRASNNVLPVSIDSIEILDKISHVSRGMVRGTFNKYIIQKEI